MPYLIASGAQLPFARGKVVRSPLSFDDQNAKVDGEPRSHNDLLRTLLNGVGVDVSSVGDLALNQGPLDRLLA